MYKKKYLKTIRGGSYINYKSVTTVKFRLYDHNGDYDIDTGFRLCIKKFNENNRYLQRKGN